MAFFSSYQDLVQEFNRDDIEVSYNTDEEHEGGAAVTRSQAKRQKVSDPALDVLSRNEEILPPPDPEFESRNVSDLYNREKEEAPSAAEAELPQERDPEPPEGGDEPPGDHEPGGDEPEGHETDQGQYYIKLLTVPVLIKIVAVTKMTTIKVFLQLYFNYNGYGKKNFILLVPGHPSWLRRRSNRPFGNFHC